MRSVERSVSQCENASLAAGLGSRIQYASSTATDRRHFVYRYFKLMRLAMTCETVLPGTRSNSKVISAKSRYSSIESHFFLGFAGGAIFSAAAFSVGFGSNRRRSGSGGGTGAGACCDAA